MPQNGLHPIAIKSVIVANAVCRTLLILLIFAGCSRRNEPVAPPVTADDRALPVAIPAETAPAKPRAKSLSVQDKIPVDDTREPVAIDDASVPADTTNIGTTRVRY